MNPCSTMRALRFRRKNLRFRRKKKWSEFSTRNCATTQISDSYALAPGITLNPGLEPDRLQQENASSSGMGLDGQFAQQRWRAGHIRVKSGSCRWGKPLPLTPWKADIPNPTLCEPHAVFYSGPCFANCL